MNLEPAAELRQVMLDMAALGLNRGSSGNASMRQPGGMLITPSGVPAEALQGDAMVLVSDNGDWASGLRPSSEWHMHQAIYAARPDVEAVVHCHSRHATALACLGEELPDFHYMVALFGGSRVPCAPYATFGTSSLADHVVATLGQLSACLLANHGQIVAAGSPAAALSLAVELEEMCAQYCIARSVGTPRLLGEAEMQRMLAKFVEYRGGKDIAPES